MAQRKMRANAAVKNASEVMPSFVKLKEGVGKRICCFVCECKKAKLPIEIVQLVLDRKWPMFAVIKMADYIVRKYGPKKRLMSKKRKERIFRFQAKALVAVCRNVQDKYGDAVVGVIHRHYNSNTTMKIHEFSPPVKGFNGTIGKGKVLIFIESKKEKSHSPLLLKRVLQHFNKKKNGKHLYSNLNLELKERIIVISSKDGTVRQQLDRLNMAQPETFNENDYRESIIEVKTFFDIERTIKQILEKYPETSVVLIDQLPYIQAGEQLYYPQIAPWLEMFKHVFGSLQDLLVIVTTEIENFRKLQNPCAELAETAINRRLTVGEQVKVISVDATSASNRQWRILSIKQTK